MITGLHVQICRMFNYDVGRRRLVPFYLYASSLREYGRTDAASVVYVRRTPSELPSARDGQPADRHTYIHGPWSRRPEESERARETYRTHAPQKHVAPSNHSFTAKTPLPRLKCRKQQAFFPYHYPRIVSYLSSGDGDKSEGRSGKKYIDIVSDRELQTPSQACRKKLGNVGNVEMAWSDSTGFV